MVSQSACSKRQVTKGGKDSHKSRASTMPRLIYALTHLHLASVVYHVAIVRDRILGRMLPESIDR